MSADLAGLDFEVSNETLDQVTLDHVKALVDAMARARRLVAIVDSSPLGVLQRQWLEQQIAQGDQILEELTTDG
jgi:hypothetical protein